MPTVEERAETLERAQLSAAHAASEFVETYQPDEGEETIAVSREAFDQLREAVSDWNFASNAFLAAERGNGSAPSRAHRESAGREAARIRAARDR